MAYFTLVSPKMTGKIYISPLQRVPTRRDINFSDDDDDVA